MSKVARRYKYITIAATINPTGFQVVTCDFCAKNRSSGLKVKALDERHRTRASATKLQNREFRKSYRFPTN